MGTYKFGDTATSSLTWWLDMRLYLSQVMSTYLVATDTHRMLSVYGGGTLYSFIDRKVIQLPLFQTCQITVICSVGACTCKA